MFTERNDLTCNHIITDSKQETSKAGNLPVTGSEHMNSIVCTTETGEEYTIIKY